MNEYRSSLSAQIVSFVSEKKATGMTYETEMRVLKDIDAYVSSLPENEQVLSQNVVEGWMRSHDRAGIATRRNYAVVVRELCKYIIRNGGESYIYPMSKLPKKSKPTPYVFSDEELKDILKAVDSCHYCHEVPVRHKVLPVFFRLLAFNGLRATEARFLQIKDVNLDTGVVTLRHTKHGKVRQVVVHPGMLAIMRGYHESVLKESLPDDLFFPGYQGRPMTLSNLEKNFRIFLSEAGIPHHGRGEAGGRLSPCIHSLRHTFAVNCLRKWVHEGKDVLAYMPILQASLGHSYLSDTLYYIHLTAALHPDIVKQEEQKLGYIIPMAYEEE